MSTYWAYSLPEKYTLDPAFFVYTSQLAFGIVLFLGVISFFENKYLPNAARRRSAVWFITVAIVCTQFYYLFEAAIKISNDMVCIVDIIDLPQLYYPFSKYFFRIFLYFVEIC